MLVNNTLDLIGNTPIVRLKRIEKELNLDFNLYAKVEKFNLSGSVKDRIALEMITELENKGIIKPGSTLIEPTSGNTGIGIACVGRLKGYDVIIVMPESMSIERRKLIAAYGAKLILTKASLGMKGAVEEAKRLNKEIEGSIIVGQFDNLDNRMAHYKHTGPEIYHDLEGNVDVFVAGIGTGGTISGVGKYLKEQNKDILVVGVEPKSSPLLTKGVAGPHKIQGIGANFIPNVLDQEVVDTIIDVSDVDALENARLLAKLEGLFVGISSGASLAGCLKLNNLKGKNVVILLPDGGEKYLSTELVDYE